MLKFVKATDEDVFILKDLCRDTPEGAEAYTFLTLYPSDVTEAFFCGKDENGVIKSVVFDNGDENIRVTGDGDIPFMSFQPKCLMIYDKHECPSFSAERIDGREIMEIYKLISGKNSLSFDDERRYVMRLRCVNSSLGAVFGIYEKGELVSVSCVSAENEKYALISDVFTREDKRNKGYARRCVDAGINYSLSKGKIPFLRCEEKMCEYYKKAGFSYYGKM